MDSDFQGIYLSVIRGYKDRHESKEVLKQNTDLQTNLAIDNVELPIITMIWLIN